MGRRQAAERAAALALLAPFALFLALSVNSAVLRRAGTPWAFVRGAATEAALPEVLGHWPWAEPSRRVLRVGDRVVSAGGQSLRGASALDYFTTLLAEKRPDLRVELEIERGGRRERVLAPLDTHVLLWPLPLAGTLLCGTALGLFLLAPPWLRVRPVCDLLAVLGFFTLSFFGGGPREETLAAVALFGGTLAVLPGAAVRAVYWLPTVFGAQAPPMPRWPWLLGILALFALGTRFGWPMTPEQGLRGTALVVALLLLVVGVRTLHLLRTLPRPVLRPGRLLLCGVLAGISGPLLGAAATALRPESLVLFVSSLGTVVLIPLAGIASVLRHRFFGIDRVVSATASYTVVVMGLLAALLALVPPVAARLAAATGLDANATQLALSVALAAVVVPLNRHLRRLLDRVFFAERHALEAGAERMLEDLGRAREPLELRRLFAERVEELLRPRELVLYARAGSPPAGPFVPVLTRGRAEAPAFEAGGRIAAALQERGAPRSGEELAEAADGDAEATRLLEDLRPALAIPIRGEEGIELVVSLGPKRSGDRFTRVDRALLRAAADQARALLRRLRDQARIDRERALARELARDRDRADDASAAKTRLLAAASHDLRQPLHALGLFAGALLERVREPGETRTIALHIAESTRALEAMFDGLLDLSRLDAGVVEARPGFTPLAPILDRLRAEFAPQAAARGLDLHIDDTDQHVCTDPVLLGRILSNLLSNAIRYTGSGRVELRAARDEEAVRLEVRDTGPGIPEEARASIFREFRQLEGEGRAAPDGLGLGLSIVDRLARLLGHPLELRSSPGEGTTFCLRVPRSADHPGAAAPARAEARRDPLRGREVLLVEEDPGARSETAAMLEELGLRVCAAGSPAEAEALLRHGDAEPEAILVGDDPGAPLRGSEVVARARELLGTRLPAALVGGETDRERIEALRRAGLPVLRRPATPARLRALLSALLGGEDPGTPPRGTSGGART